MTHNSCPPQHTSHPQINYINTFRALAIILIVMGHSFVSAHWAICPWTSVLLNDGTVLFVFISGFLFQYLSDTFEYRRYLKKKFFNILCPYLVTSLIGFLALAVYPAQNPFVHMDKWLQIPMFLTTGYFHNVPTWYIPMTCIFFLCADVLLVTERKTLLGKPVLFYILIIGLFFSLGFPRRGFSLTGEDIKTYLLALQTIGYCVFHFFPIYILGMFMACRTSYIKKFYQQRVWLWILLGLITTLNVWKIYLQSTNPTLAQKLVLTLLVLGYVEHYDTWLQTRQRLNRWIKTVASYSFAIFFLHFYLLWVTKFSLEYILHINRDISVLDISHVTVWVGLGIIQFCIAFFGSLFLAMAVKKILSRVGITHTRYFIGA